MLTKKIKQLSNRREIFVVFHFFLWIAVKTWSINALKKKCKPIEKYQIDCNEQLKWNEISSTQVFDFSVLLPFTRVTIEKKIICVMLSAINDLFCTYINRIWAVSKGKFQVCRRENKNVWTRLGLHEAIIKIL